MTEHDALRQARADLLYSHERNTSLCAPFLSVVPVTGASVSLLAGGAVQATMCASDLTAARLDEIQFDIGEGPCWDALSTRRPVLMPDLGNTDSDWPLFFDALVGDPLGASVRSVFAFPLFVGSLDIGAVDLYSTSTGPLQHSQVTDATELAGLAAWQVLRRILADHESGVDVEVEPTTGNRREVHQATGMVLAQLGVSAEDALLLLRAHAFSTGRSVAEVANDVVERRLDFGSDNTA
jgi:hypothetical protein